MDGRLKRLILTGFIFLMAVVAARPYIVGRAYSATALRAVERRGDIAEYERTTIGIFDRVSPSVVQMADSSDDSDFDNEETAVKTGTGFVWDTAGHVVTNYHVVQGAKVLTMSLRQAKSERRLSWALRQHTILP